MKGRNEETRRKEGNEEKESEKKKKSIIGESLDWTKKVRVSVSPRE